MAYDFYLNKILLPIAPSSLSVKIKNQNSTVNLINDGEASVLKAPGLTEYSFDFLLPAQKYPFAKYISKFRKPKYILDKLEKWKVEKKSITLTVSRVLPNGKGLFDTSQKVVIEDYTIKEEAKEGFDVKVSIKLKQYKPFKTKKCKVTIKDTSKKKTAKVEKSKERPAGENQPQTGTTYTVVSGDSLWKIAKHFYGNGAEYPKIFDANKDKISNPNLIYPGQMLNIP